MKKRLISMLLCVCMVLAYFPTTVFAAEEAGLCEHHGAHTTDCGYAAAVDGAACGHVHDTSCGYAEAVTEVLCTCTETDAAGVVMHTEGCGYVAGEAARVCCHVHDADCGYAEPAAEQPCAYVCADCAVTEPVAEPVADPVADPVTEPAAEETEAVEEVILQTEEIVQEPVCTCGTDDSAFHATFCALYEAPAEPQCTCVEKCAEPNHWCDVCGFDYAACGGEDTAGTYEEEPCTHADEDKTKGYCDLCGELLVTAEGTSADGLHWVYYEGNRTLIITGEGPMQNYGSNNVPWEDFDTKIQSLVIGEGVTTIGDYAFHQGWNLTSVSIPSTITSIGKYAFDESKSLTSIDLPENLVTIGDYAFHECNALTSIVLPDSVTTLGAHAFAYCGNLTSVQLSENLTEIPESAFNPCSKLTSVVIPASVQTIGKQAFRDCKSIATITLNEGLKYIGEQAFYNCDVLEAVSIPGSVTVIDKSAFNKCNALASLTLTEGLETIGDSAFRECANLTLTNENLPSTLTTLGSYAFFRTAVTSVVFPDSLQVIDTSAFKACPNLASITLPKGLTTVGDYAFQECTALQNVIFPESITAATIESYVFEKCTSLTSLYISGGITKIGGYAFRGCTALRDVTILDGLQESGANKYGLSSNAFAECQDLNMILPATLTEVSSYAFSDASISSAHYLGTEEALAKVDFHSDKVLSSKIHACIMAEGKTATCTEPGYSSGWMCEKCDFTMGAVETAPLGHKYSDGVCENCGEACVHTGGEATCTHRAKCTVCKESYGERNPDNHVKDTFYYRNKDENVHIVRHSCCEAIYKTEAHTYENGECIFCGADEPAGIIITQQPTDAKVAMDDVFCVTVEAQGEGLKYQWYFKNAGTDKWYKSGVRDNTYDDVMTKARAGREIYCVITDAFGNTVTTETAKLIRVPKAELKILTQPVSDEAAMGEDFCVTVEAQGEDLKYQWYFKNAGTDKWYTSGVRDNTYDDVMTKARAGREIYCVITDAFGNTVTTETAKLIRVPKAELKIVTQPVSDEAAMGEDFCVTVEAQGEDLKYQWYFKNAGTDKWYKSGVRDNTYDDVMTKARAGREIYCVITDAFGNTVTTETAKLIRVPKAELKIVTQPVNDEAAMGEDFCVTVEAQGEDLKYQWYFKNAGTDKWYTSGVRDNTYDDVMTKARAGREIYCIITDALGNQLKTDTATLVLSK